MLRNRLRKLRNGTSGVPWRNGPQNAPHTPGKLGKRPLEMAPLTDAAISLLLLKVVTDAPPWRVAAAVLIALFFAVIALSFAVMAVCLRRAG